MNRNIHSITNARMNPTFIHSYPFSYTIPTQTCPPVLISTYCALHSPLSIMLITH